MRIKIETTTSKVERVLRESDDFLSLDMIEKKTTSSRNQIQAALFHLRKRHVIDVIVNADGTGWWYALPMEEDDRMRTVDERAPEVKPRNRKSKAKAK